jgi:hypothetical protein
MIMTNTLADVCCASIPQDALAHLAALRTSPKLRVQQVHGRMWLYWPAGTEDILQCVMPIHSVELFALCDGKWYRPGLRLPVFDVPDETQAKPLVHWLSPAPVAALGHSASAVKPLRFRLVRDDQPRATTALVCPAAALLKWAESATTRQLESVEVAACEQRALLRGKRLPALAGATRYWGNYVLFSLGFRWEPDLPESAIRGVLRLETGNIAIVHNDDVELVPRDALQTATRAGIRRQWGVHAP